MHRVFKKKWLRFAYVVLALALLSSFAKVSAASDINYGQNYVSYIYNFKGNPVSVPAAYEAVDGLSGYDYGNIPFKDIYDITYDGKNNLYVADTGNNRIVVLNRDLKLVSIIDSYYFKGEKVGFKEPSCTSIMNGKVYIADSQNARIVMLSQDSNETIKVFEQPQIAALGDYTYIPTKIAVDYAERIYVIIKNINKGLIQLNKNGEFENFLGAPKVKPNLSQVIFRKFFPKSMRYKLENNVPTEYNAVTMDQNGFLYTTSQSTEIAPITRLNGQGSNVIKFTYQSPSGDKFYVDDNNNKMNCSFSDVISRNDGGYFALDSANGRIFSYDKSGILLYIFGSSGTNLGSFYSASSMEYFDSKIIVADRSTGQLTTFALTEFGAAVNKASLLNSKGENSAKEAWEDVLKLCSNYETAEIQLSKIDINNGDYRSAMNRLEAIGEKNNYATAFEHARTEWFEANFYRIVLILIILVILIILWKKVIKRLKLVKQILESKFCKDLAYSKYVIFHPFDGFWDLKHESKANIKVAIAILTMFSVFWGIRARFTGYLFMDKSSDEVNVIFSVATIIIPILLFVLSNWCFTTLMEGKGTMKDTFIYVCYSLAPYVIISPIQLVLSHFLVNQETAFYGYIDTLTLIWVILLLFVGMMMTHDYSFAKALITAVLTLVGICVILFLCLILYNLTDRIYRFFYDLYKEISSRFY